MGSTLAIARRELLSYLLSPAGYVIMAVFMVFTSLLFFLIGAVFGGGFNQGEPASIRLFASVGAWAFLFIAPAISMRSFSEEFRMGTYESLMSAPVSETQIVFGKFAGAMVFLAIMLAPTVIFVIALEWHGRPDYGELTCGYAGMMLAGSAYLASGMLASTLTTSQVVAYLLTLFFWLIALLATKGLPLLTLLLKGMGESADQNRFVSGVIEVMRAVGGVLATADPHARLQGFAIGLLDSFNVIYFVSVTGFFLAAAIASLGARRWR